MTSDARLRDRQLLQRAGRALSTGRLRLEDIAEALEVPVPALAGALERLHGVVPAPPRAGARRDRRVS